MTLPPGALPPRPSLLGATYGIARLVATSVLLVGGTVAILACAPFGNGAGRARPAERVAQWLCQTMLAIAGIELGVHGRDRLAAHRGFVFFNHISYLDPVILVATTPMRFLSTAGVRHLPFIGWMATALGTVYVNRGRGESREKARRVLGDQVRQSHVPVGLAPEGRIGPGPQVLPLRHGAFEVAADAQASILLVSLQFEPYGYAAWLDGEWLLRAYWRLCARTRPVAATLRVLEQIEPDSHSRAEDRARHAESVFNHAASVAA